MHRLIKISSVTIDFIIKISSVTIDFMFV